MRFPSTEVTQLIHVLYILFKQTCKHPKQLINNKIKGISTDFVHTNNNNNNRTSFTYIYIVINSSRAMKSTCGKT